MDTSKEYIEMCSKAQEIQESKSDWIDELSFLYTVEFNTISSSIERDQFNHPSAVYESKGRIIILPRQDQLQDMIMTAEHLETYISPFFKIFHAFEDFIREDNYKYSKEFTLNNSFEQLWLAFVMKEKYNKTWNSNSKIWE